MKAKFINALGAELELTDTAPFILQKLDIGNNVTIYKSKGMMQDGETYLGNTLDKKDITIQFAISADSEAMLDSLRQKVNKVFNPKLNEGYLIYKGKKIKCIATKLPFYSKNIGNIYSECLITLDGSPFFSDISENKSEIALWKGQFHFPLSIPNHKGIIMGLKQPSLIVNIYNKGDVKTGMVIEFRARGTLSNPSLFNVNTREYLKINKTMAAGEVIRVNTNYGEKRIENILNGVTTNILNLIDLGGGDTFLQLDVGDNLLRYDADTNPSNLEINIYFSPKYLGV